MLSLHFKNHYFTIYRLYVGTGEVDVWMYAEICEIFANGEAKWKNKITKNIQWLSLVAVDLAISKLWLIPN